MSVASHRPWSGVVAGPLVAVALIAGSLTGCSGPAADLDRTAADQLQAQVLTVTKDVAANNPAGALKALDELAAKLDAAAADGKVSFKRHQSIRTALDAVRADLTAKQAAAAKAIRDAAAKKAAAEKAAADKAAADQAAADAAAAAAAAAAAQNAPVGKAKGKNKGKGDH